MRLAFHLGMTVITGGAWLLVLLVMVLVKHSK
jgi:hypothetical protein